MSEAKSAADAGALSILAFVSGRRCVLDQIIDWVLAAYCHAPSMQQFGRNFAGVLARSILMAALGRPCLALCKGPYLGRVAGALSSSVWSPTCSLAAVTSLNAVQQAASSRSPKR